MALTFSIVTPSLNQGRFIEQTIKSVLSQKGDFFIDYIIIDGGSTDGTLPIIEKYELLLSAKKWPVKCNGIKYRWMSEPDRGQSHAVNKGFALAHGEVLAWLNSDDFYSSGALRIVAEEMHKNPAAGAVVGAGEMLTENGDRVFYAESFPVNKNSLYKWINRYFYQPSCFFSKAAWDKCGPLKDWLEYAMDLDLWLNITDSFEFIPLSSMLSTSLKHNDAKTTAFWYLTAMEVAIVVASHGGGEIVRQDYAKLISDMEEQHKQLINKFVTSRSWKITTPLRALSSAIIKRKSS